MPDPLCDNMMASSETFVDWVTWAFSPAISAILVAILISTLLPILCHYYLYRKAESASVPAYLLVGPSGAGKTTILTLVSDIHVAKPEHCVVDIEQFSSGSLLPTQTSQEPQTAQCQLPDAISSSDDQYRSVNDTSSRTQPKFVLIDTPGHGKLRHHAASSLTSTSALRGLLFVLDSAAVSSSSGLYEAAEYLHDVLLTLQKRHTTSKTSKDPQSIPVLILANKQDVFTSLPTSLVQKKLEEEVAKIRLTKSKGLLDSGIGMEGGDAADEEQHWLGEFGSKQFALSQMQEHGIDVTIIGGNAKGGDGKPGKIQEWWRWIGQNL